MRDEAGPRSFSLWVDAFRWLAAMSVLVTHAGIRMLAPIGDAAAPGLAHAAYAFAAGFDHQAVMAFFVISGLLVGGSVVREISATGRFALGPYLARRLVRLCIVLWPALALAAACTALALRWGAAERGILPPDIAGSMTMAALACNLAFLQTAACPQWAGNGALWSLFNEVWYYLLFPPLALALLANRPAAARIALAGGAAAALAGLTAAQFTGAPVGPYMLVWLVGVAVAVADRPLIRRPAVAAALLGAALLAVRLGVRRSFAGAHPVLSTELDLALAGLFGLLLLSLKCRPGLRPPPWPRLHRVMAGCSFSLYCTHIPVLVLYITVLAALTGTGWQMQGAGPGPWAAIGGGLALCLAAGWGFAQLTETHTDAARRWLAAPRPAAGTAS